MFSRLWQTFPAIHTDLAGSKVHVNFLRMGCLNSLSTLTELWRPISMMAMIAARRQKLNTPEAQAPNIWYRSHLQIASQNYIA